MKPKLIVILGPTAVGKSEIALELAQRIGGEIIDANFEKIDLAGLDFERAPQGSGRVYGGNDVRLFT